MEMKYFSNLPLELVYLILSYTIKPQCPILLNDIRHFYRSRNHIMIMYYDIFINNIGNLIPQNNYMLVKDIYSYSDRSMLYLEDSLYIYNYYDLFFRNPRFKNNKLRVDKFVSYLNTQYVNSTINILWALLNIDEREFIIQNTYCKYIQFIDFSYMNALL